MTFVWIEALWLLLLIPLLVYEKLQRRHLEAR